MNVSNFVFYKSLRTLPAFRTELSPATGHVTRLGSSMTRIRNTTPTGRASTEPAIRSISTVVGFS